MKTCARPENIISFCRYILKSPLFATRETHQNIANRRKRKTCSIFRESSSRAHLHSKKRRAKKIIFLDLYICHPANLLPVSSKNKLSTFGAEFSKEKKHIVAEIVKIDQADRDDGIFGNHASIIKWAIKKLRTWCLRMQFFF